MEKSLFLLFCNKKTNCLNLPWPPGWCTFHLISYFWLTTRCSECTLFVKWRNTCTDTMKEIPMHQPLPHLPSSIVTYIPFQSANHSVPTACWLTQVRWGWWEGRVISLEHDHPFYPQNFYSLSRVCSPLSLSASLMNTMACS